MRHTDRTDAAAGTGSRAFDLTEVPDDALVLATVPEDCLIRATDQQGAVRWYHRTATGINMLSPQWSFGSLMSLPVADMHAALETATPASGDGLRLLAPLDPETEVWACGVTYEVSWQARMEESAHADIYDRVYDADRPEMFFKSIGWRVSGQAQPVGVRADSRWNVPEPELALVCNEQSAVVGYTTCNDMSSRSIEGENPLYLPQAKTYQWSCAVGPWIRLSRAIPTPTRLGISVSILRSGARLWSGRTSTGRMHRSLEELVSYLFHAQTFPRGVVLATGTSAVPDDSVSIRDGDIVDIEIEGIGHLVNRVVTVGTVPTSWSQREGRA